MPLEKLREEWQRQLIADRTLTADTLRVALAISWRLNRDTRIAFPGISHLVALTGAARSTVIRATKRLEARGHLQITRPPQRSERASNRYRPLLKRFNVGAHTFGASTRNQS